MSVYSLYKSMRKLPLGHWLFSRAVCTKAPYFATVKPLVTQMQPGRAEVVIKKARRVHNHIQTVHVIAICNALEMAMGMVVEASIPKHLRWIPKNMTVHYPAKANSDIRAVAELDVEDFQADKEVVVRVNAYRDDDEVVVAGEIIVWVTAKK